MPRFRPADPPMILDLHTHSVRSDDGRAKVDNYCQWIQRKELPLDGIVLTEHRQFDAESDYRALEDQYGLLILKASEVETDYGHCLVFGVNDDLVHAFDFARIDNPLGRGHRRRQPLRGVRRAVPPGPQERRAVQPLRDARARCEGVEVVEIYNGGSIPGEDEKSVEQAARYGYRGIGGSDSHIVSRIGCCATEFDRRHRDHRRSGDGPAGREVRGTDMADVDDLDAHPRAVGRQGVPGDRPRRRRRSACSSGRSRAARPTPASSTPTHPDFQASTSFPTHINAGPHAARRLPRASAPAGASTAASRSSGTGRSAPATRSHADGRDRRHLRQDGPLGHDDVHRQPHDVLPTPTASGRHRRLAHDPAGRVTMRFDDVELGDELPEERPDVSLETVRAVRQGGADGLPPLHRPRARPRRGPARAR